MQHPVIALVHDRPGVLNRAISLFRRRSFNIHSLAVATTEQPGLSRMTLVVQRDDVSQVVRQLERLVDVISVRDVTHQRVVAHELCLVRLTPPLDLPSHGLWLVVHEDLRHQPRVRLVADSVAALFERHEKDLRPAA